MLYCNVLEGEGEMLGGVSAIRIADGISRSGVKG